MMTSVLYLVRYTQTAKGLVMDTYLSTVISMRLKTLVLVENRQTAYMASQVLSEYGQMLPEMVRKVRNGMEKHPTKRSAREREMMK